MLVSPDAPFDALPVPPAALLADDPELQALRPRASAAIARMSGLLKRRGTFIVVLLLLLICLTEGKCERRTPL
jgi:hypothetical protein